MTAEHPYASTRIPAPHLPVVVGAPGGGATVPEALALVDSGADRTLVPEAVVTQLQLPELARLEFEVGGGDIITLPIYRVALTVRGFSPVLVEAAVSAGEERILLGRDVLNEYLVTLDGPKQRVGISDE